MLGFDLVIASLLQMIRVHAEIMKSVPLYLQIRFHGDRSDVQNSHETYNKLLEAVILGFKSLFWGIAALAIYAVLPLVSLCIVLAIVFSPNLIINIIFALILNVVKLLILAAVGSTAIAAVWFIGNILVFCPVSSI